MILIKSDTETQSLVLKSNKLTYHSWRNLCKESILFKFYMFVAVHKGEWMGIVLTHQVSEVTGAWLWKCSYLIKTN